MIIQKRKEITSLKGRNLHNLKLSIKTISLRQLKPFSDSQIKLPQRRRVQKLVTKPPDQRTSKDADQVKRERPLN